MTDLPGTETRSLPARIFYSPDEPRLRAGWRLLIQTILMIILAVIFSILGSLLDSFLDAGLIWSQLIEFCAFFGSIYIARRWLDKRSFVSLGVKLDRHTLLDVLAGIGITFVQMGFIYAAMFSLGWITFEGFAWEFDPVTAVIGGVLIYFVGYILVGWNEELLSRGYHLQTIASGLNLFWGVIISSAIFGVLHLFNPGATWVSTLGIFLAGLYLAYGYLRTKQLWLSIGLHIGWNFFEGVVFGFPVSGTEAYKLARITVQGPELWTGGIFGPEAGLIVLPALLIGGVLIFLYTQGRAGSPEA